jgi:selenide,water dikinase
LVGEITELQKSLLCDPQTSGGLLVAVENEHIAAFKEVAKSEGFELESIGELSARTNDTEAYINVK